MTPIRILAAFSGSQASQNALESTGENLSRFRWSQFVTTSLAGKEEPPKGGTTSFSGS
jgi:hypothetical protein